MGGVGREDVQKKTESKTELNIQRNYVVEHYFLIFCVLQMKINVKHMKEGMNER